MRIPESTIDQITNSLPLSQIVGEYTALTKKGDRLWGCCPFHQEKTPSFTVNDSKGLYYCFGCHEGGSLFTFIQKMEKCSFTDAVQFCAKKAGIALQLHPNSEYDKHKSSLLELYQRTAAALHYLLKKNAQAEKARKYLEERVVYPSAIDDFLLGYFPSDREWLYHFLKKNHYSDEFLQKSGLFLEKKPKISYFSDMILFPIFDIHHQVIAFGGRNLKPEGPKYINSPETGIFKKRNNLFGLSKAIRSGNKIDRFILVEGYVDVLCMHQAGLLHTIAPLGTALTEDQIRLLKRYTENVVLFFDGDDAGRKASCKAIPLLEKGGMQTTVIDISNGMDPADIFKKEGPEALQNILKYPISAFNYTLNNTEKKYSIHTAEGRIGFFKEILPFINAIESEIKRESYFVSIAERLGISYQALLAEWNKTLKLSQSPQGGNKPAEIKKTPLNITKELYLMICILSDFRFFEEVRKEIGIEELTDQNAKKIYILLEESFRNGVFNLAQVLENLENEDIKRSITQKIASNEFSAKTDQRIKDSILYIKIENTRRKQMKLISKIKQLEAGKSDSQTVNELLMEKMYLDNLEKELLNKRIKENDEFAE